MIKINMSKLIIKYYSKLKEWIKIQTRLINERRLNLYKKKDFYILKKKFIDFCLKKFFYHQCKK
ncbi:Fe(2+)-trafficking protein [Candidatus Vidania fulgoroideorum]